MNDLQLTNQNGQAVVSSRQVAENFDKEHKNVIRDIETILGGMLKTEPAQMFFKTTYVHPQNHQEYPEFLMNRDGFTLLAMGFNGQAAMQWKIKYIQAFNDMEKQLQSLSVPQSLPEALRAYADEVESHEKTKIQLAEAKPKVLFAESVQASHTSILIGELAKILKQNGIEIGQNRMFEWLRKKGYLINRKGTDYNMPTQYSMQLGIFTIKETTVNHSDGHISISKTPKVTGKGQIYFVNKFLEST